MTEFTLPKKSRYTDGKTWPKPQDAPRVQALRIYRWYTPLLHLDTHVKLVQYIKLAMAERGLGSEMVRAPRLPLVGAERERILALIQKAINTRPRVPEPVV